MDIPDIRSALLELIAKKDAYFREDRNSRSLQQGSILSDLEQQLGPHLSYDMQEAILTCWYDLFRNGILSWGYNLNNTNPPFCHLTEHGRKILENLSRDPSNPNGYMAFLLNKTKINPIARSYIEEALNTYNSGCFKASAVMVGAASESLVLTVQASLIDRMTTLRINKPRDLDDWRVKKILLSIENAIKQRKKLVPDSLYESFEAYWPAFTHQIRTVRNDSGHPSSIAPVTTDNVHASLLIFPELSILVDSLLNWITNSMKE